MAGKSGGRKSILDMIPDDLDQAVDVPAAFRRTEEPPSDDAARVPAADAEAPATEPAIQPAAQPTTEPAASATVERVGPVGPDAIPLPRVEATVVGPLDEGEHSDLAVCEAAIGNLRTAFWAAGKALSAINQGRLYRETHPTFEEYCLDRWEMSRPQAYRLMEAWPLAEALSPIGDRTLNESQVRELLPVQAKHGQDAAVVVYAVVAEAGKVTAAALRGAVGALSDERFDQARAVEQIRAYLAGHHTEAAPASALSKPPGGTDVLTVEAQRLRSALTRPKSKATLRAAAKENPAQIRAVLDELLAVVAEIQSWLGESEQTEP